MKNKGITLITLVITIIILLILAGIGINLSLGENGIFRRAKEAREKYMTAEEKEQQELNELYSQIAKIDLPENTKETEAGTKVQIPNNWVTISPNYVNTEDGSIVKKMTVSSTVYAVSGGKGTIVPVPEGFYYVGGDIDTGIVISDNNADENKYKGKTEQITDEEGNNNTKAYVGKEDLVGNQFVWIECNFNNANDIVNYGKTNFYNIYGEYDTTIPSAEISYVKKYNGFYIARYEAGLPTQIEEIKENTYYTSDIYNKVGIPQSKAGLVPWNFVEWETSKASAEKMYQNSNSISSGLVTGAQWDTTLNTIINKTEVTIEDTKGTGSRKFGNYYDNEIKYTGRKASFISGNYLTPFGEKEVNAKTTLNSYDLLTTGASETTKIYNIYDMAGNLWEWTDEVSFYGGNTSKQYRELRGGSFANSTSEFPAECRNGGNDINYTDFHFGFRVVLYIK